MISLTSHTRNNPRAMVGSSSVTKHCFAFYPGVSTTARFDGTIIACSVTMGYFGNSCGNEHFTNMAKLVRASIPSRRERKHKSHLFILNSHDLAGASSVLPMVSNVAHHPLVLRRHQRRRQATRASFGRSGDDHKHHLVRYCCTKQRVSTYHMAVAHFPPNPGQ